MKVKPGLLVISLLVAAVLLQLAMTLSSPVSAYDAKVGSDSATVSVATSEDGKHVYICDGQRCYASHDSGQTFARMKVD
jgi:photosystem II stability/assembly factor-like uncharacterized protein